MSGNLPAKRSKASSEFRIHFGERGLASVGILVAAVLACTQSVLGQDRHDDMRLGSIGGGADEAMTTVISRAYVYLVSMSNHKRSR